MEKQDVGRLMDILSAAYPRFYDKMQTGDKMRTAALWVEMLSEYETEKVLIAAKNYIKHDESGFPPSIGQIISRIDRGSAVNASESWLTLYKAICNSGYNSVEEFNRLPASIQRYVGGPEQLRTWAMSNRFDPIREREQFIKYLDENRDKDFLEGENRYFDMLSRPEGYYDGALLEDKE